MKAAVPHYMQDIELAAAGHRFGLYFQGWDNDWKLADGSKQTALQKISLTEGDKQRSSALVTRQQTAAMLLDDVLTVPAVSTAPFVTGMGIEHPVENGFAFLSPYGLPYLPGSSVKGVLRTAAVELGVENIDLLFGSDKEEGLQGKLAFWDAFPQGDLTVEMMTAHHSDYLQNKGTPHDSENLVPIPFLCIAPHARFLFTVHCIGNVGDYDWQDALRQCFEYAFDWLGFGAKTSVGYGAMKNDSDAASQLNAQKEAAREAKEAARIAAKEQTTLAAMSDEDRVLFQLKKQAEGWHDNGTFLADVEQYMAENDTMMPAVVAFLASAIEEKNKGIMSNPDAVKGKKKDPKYKARHIAIAKQLIVQQGACHA